MLVGSHAGVSFADEEPFLRRQLQDECTERDAARLALQRLEQTVNFYRQRLRAMAPSAARISRGEETGLGGHKRLRELVQSLEAEVRGITITEASLALREAPSPGSRTQSYEVLKQSLTEAARRCESLNSDLVHQAEANEELVETLATVKDANKRLLEQIRFQTDEISQLTQQRVSDEEMMDRLTRSHNADHDAYRQETQHQLQAIRDAAGEEYRAVEQRLREKLQYLKTRCEFIYKEVARMVADHRQLRDDAGCMAALMPGRLHQLEEEILARCGCNMNAYNQHRGVVNEGIAELERQLRAERELRHSDNLEWGNKDSALSLEREDVKARMVRDVSQLSSKSQALERLLDAERGAWAEERVGLERRIEDARQEKVAKNSELEQMQRENAQLEAGVRSVVGTVSGLRQTVEELRAQALPSDDALAAAVSGNEHLRQQMDEQHKRLQDMSEADLTAARFRWEQKLARAHEAHGTDTALATQQLQALEDELKREEQATEGLRVQRDVVAEECKTLQQEIETLTSDIDKEKAARQGAEQELAEGQRSFAVEKLRLQAEIDQLTAKNAEAEDDIRRTKEHVEEFLRVASARETDHETRVAASEVALRSSQEQLADLRRRLAEATETKTKLDTEASTNLRKHVEIEEKLQQDLDSRRREVDEERLRLQDLLAEETKAIEQARAELERERASSLSTLKHMKEDSQTKLGAVEREWIRAEETCKEEINAAQEDVARRQRAVDALENDVARLRSLLAESEGNHSWVQTELEREDRARAEERRRITDALRQGRLQLEQAKREEEALTRQLEDANRRKELDRAHVAQEVEAARRVRSAELADLELRLSRARADLDLERRGHAERCAPDRKREESLERENMQLRSILAERGHSTVGLAALHNRLEGAVQQLQRRTEEIRYNLNDPRDTASGIDSSLRRASRSPSREAGGVRASWDRFSPSRAISRERVRWA